jgi:hypothetical protein
MNPSEFTLGTDNDDDMVVIDKYNDRRISKYYYNDTSNDKSPISIATRRI